MTRSQRPLTEKKPRDEGRASRRASWLPRPSWRPRGPGRPFDRRTRRAHRHEQERSVRAFQLEGRAPARDDRARERAVLRRGDRRPAHARGEGLRLLWALCDEFLSHLERDVFPGGCFFAAVGAEFSGHPGRVKERVVGFTMEWLGELEAAATQAQAAGELPASPDAAAARLRGRCAPADGARRVHDIRRPRIPRPVAPRDRAAARSTACLNPQGRGYTCALSGL